MTVENNFPWSPACLHHLKNAAAGGFAFVVEGGVTYSEEWTSHCMGQRGFEAPERRVRLESGGTEVKR